MLQPRLGGSSMPVGRDVGVSLNTVAAAFNSLTLCSRHSHPRSQLPSSFAFVRHATHAAQGRANGPKDSAGRRLGAKKSASEYVIPGNIIFKQRGTKWFPGENVDMGKDHTLYATVAGYVRYYRNPALHPKRRYIGVALERDGPKSKLPTPVNAPTRRRLGMYTAPIREESDAEFLNGHLSTNSKGARLMDEGSMPKSMVAGIPLRPGKIWPSNYEIGKTAERMGVVVKTFDRKDRWLAWRKRNKRIKEKVLARAAKATRKTKGKKSNKGVSMGKK